MNTISTLITSIILYCGTAADSLVILMHFFSKAKDQKQRIGIYIGQFIGSGFLILISLFFAYVLHFIPQKQFLGFLGLIPVILGVKVLIWGDSDSEVLANENTANLQIRNLIKKVSIIIIASCGADNIGLFVPYFTSLSFHNLLLTLIIFLILPFMLVGVAYQLTTISTVGKLLEKYSRWFISIIYIILGISILVENNSISFLIKLLPLHF